MLYFLTNIYISNLTERRLEIFYVPPSENVWTIRNHSLVEIADSYCLVSVCLKSGHYSFRMVINTLD